MLKFCAGDHNPHLGAQRVGANQPDSQLMMANERGLSRLDAGRSKRAFLASDHSCNEQQEIDRLTLLDQASEGGLNAGRRVQIQLQGSEVLRPVLSRELSGRFLDLRQTAPSDDDLVVALYGEQVQRFLQSAAGVGAALVERRFRDGIITGDIPPDFPVAVRAVQVTDLARGLIMRVRLGTPRKTLLKDAEEAPTWCSCRGASDE